MPQIYNAFLMPNWVAWEVTVIFHAFKLFDENIFFPVMQNVTGFMIKGKSKMPVDTAMDFSSRLSYLCPMVTEKAAKADN